MLFFNAIIHIILIYKKKILPTPPGDLVLIPSPLDIDNFLMSFKNTADDLLRSANPIKPNFKIIIS